MPVPNKDVNDDTNLYPGSDITLIKEIICINLEL